MLLSINCFHLSVPASAALSCNILRSIDVTGLLFSMDPPCQLSEKEMRKPMIGIQISFTCLGLDS